METTTSLGLMIPPRIRIIERMAKANKNRIEKKVEKSSDEEETEGEVGEKNRKCCSRINLQGDGLRLIDDESDDEDVLTIKRRDIDIDISADEFGKNEVKVGKEKVVKPVTKAAVVKKMMKKKIVQNKKINFNEDGEEILDPTKTKISQRGKMYEEQIESGINLEFAKETLRQEDVFDKEYYRQKNKERKREAKRKLKEQRKLVGKDFEEDEEEEDEYEDSHSNDSDGYVMPDPDVLFGKQTESEEESNDLVYRKKGDESVKIKRKIMSSDNESEMSKEEDEIHRPRKRKLIESEDKKALEKKQKLPEVNKNLRADEELVLQLLRR